MLLIKLQRDQKSSLLAISQNMGLKRIKYGGYKVNKPHMINILMSESGTGYLSR